MTGEVLEELEVATRECDLAGRALDEAARRLEVVANRLIRETGPHEVEADHADEVEAMQKVKELQGRISGHGSRCKAVAKSASDGQKQADKVHYAVRRLYAGVVERGEEEQRRRQEKEERRQQEEERRQQGFAAGTTPFTDWPQPAKPAQEERLKTPVEVAQDALAEVMDDGPSPRTEALKPGKPVEVLDDVREAVVTLLSGGALPAVEIRAKVNVTAEQIGALKDSGAIVRIGKKYHLPAGAA